MIPSAQKPANVRFPNQGLVVREFGFCEGNPDRDQ